MGLGNSGHRASHRIGHHKPNFLDHVLLSIHDLRGEISP